MQARIALENLLADGQLDEVLELYVQLSRQYDDEERLEQGIMESGRYSSLMEQQLDGTISQADYQLERAKINKSVLSMLSDLPDTWKHPYEPLPAQHPPKPTTTSHYRYWIPAAALVLLLIAASLWFFTKADTNHPAQAATTPPSQAQVPPEPSRADTLRPVEKTNSQPAVTREKAKPSTKSSPTVPNAVSKPFPRPNPPVAAPTLPTHSTTPPTYATPDNKFRSFAKSQIADGMEKGFVGNTDRVAYRNLQTGAILCCYETGSAFSNGKALVQQNGQRFYIDKSGQRITEF